MPDTPLTLSQFIRDNLEPILVEWEAFARTLLPAAGTMTALALRDHARQILSAVADDMETAQSHREQRDKSHGLGSKSIHSAATVHGGLRHDVGFTLIQLVAEYRALRASVLRLWSERQATLRPEHLVEMTRFNEAIDQAIADSVSQYSQDLAKARDTFTAILGHDLRSPLSAIIMSAHNIGSSRLTPEMREGAMRTISASAAAMKEMIHNLLDFAGSRLGRSLAVRLEPCRLDTVCGHALNEVMAAHPERNFEFAAEGDLHGEFDPSRIAQVLSNLLNNALNHGDPEQAVSMKARGIGEQLVVDITNRGKPIDPATLKCLFDPTTFARTDMRSGSSGLGLGLYIAREITTAHSGTLTAASGPESTTFTVALPRRPGGGPRAAA